MIFIIRDTKKNKLMTWGITWCQKSTSGWKQLRELVQYATTKIKAKIGLYIVKDEHVISL